MLSNLFLDIRYGLRLLGKSPGISLNAILHPRAGDRGEYGDVQRGEFSSAAPAAVPVAGAAGDDLGDQSA